MTPMFESSLEIGSTSMAELIQATNVYYSTVEGFVTSNPLLLNLRRVAGHIMRERDMYNISFLSRKNVEACADTLMNGHWEELFGKVEELFDATDNPDNYHMHIEAIISWSSDGRRRLESFLRPHVIECVQGVIEAMSSTSGCASTLVDLQQRLGDRAEWIHVRMGRSIDNEAFEEVLRDHPDLRNAVKALVSVLCQSFK